jgi:hypothetical protein
MEFEERNGYLSKEAARYVASLKPKPKDLLNYTTSG